MMQTDKTIIYGTANLITRFHVERRKNMVGGITGTSYGSTYNYKFPVGNIADSNISPTKALAKTSDENNSINGTEKSKKSECQTCKERKYVDGSNEGNVSFKSPGHISPESSMAVVSAHEQEHVANAQAEGSKEGAELVSANVKLTSSVCTECGSSYISGGTTTTQIKYTESNPYDRAKKTIEGSFLKGQNVDLVA